MRRVRTGRWSKDCGDASDTCVAWRGGLPSTWSVQARSAVSHTMSENMGGLALYDSLSGRYKGTLTAQRRTGLR